MVMAISCCLYDKYIFIYIFHTTYLDYILPLPQLLPDPDPLPSFLSTHLHVCSLLSKQKSKQIVKIKTNKLKQKSIKTKKKNYEKFTHKNMESILCWPNTPLQEIYPGIWQKCQVTFYWRKLIFLFLSHKLSISLASWLGVRLSVHFPIPRWNFVQLKPVAVLVHAVAVSESLYVY